MSGQAALGRLLPLLLPRDRAGATDFQTQLLRRNEWVETATERGLAPAFHVFLRQGDYWDSLSPHAQDCLDTAYRENLANCLAQEHVLGGILALLSTLGGLPVLLKGLAFATELYPEPAARLAGDIDLLVPPAWKDDASRRLLGAGFELISLPPHPPGRLKSLLGRATRPACVSPGNQPRAGGSEDEGEAVFLTRVAGRDILIELHCHLINLRAGGGKAEVFRSHDEGLPPTRRARLSVGEVRVLDHEVAFLHALRHVALHHRLIGFRWHHDLALMLVRWERFLDPDRLRARCLQLNSAKILSVELALLRELFGPGIFPEHGRQRWESSALPWEYPLYRHVARGGKRTPLRELVRTLLAPTFREQLQTLT